VPAVVDGEGRFERWADGPGGSVRVGDSLRAALAALLLTDREVVALIDADDVFCGAITVEDVFVTAGRRPSGG
jgi:hypothetical protein